MGLVRWQTFSTLFGGAAVCRSMETDEGGELNPGGMLNMSSFTPNPSDYDNLSPAFVDDATALATAADFEQHQQQQHPLPSTAGEVPVYSQRWVQRHPELPRYTGAAFGNRPRTYGGGPLEEYPYYDSSSETSARPPNPFYSEDEFRCAARLRKLLYYLKKQYYLDNKYIQSVYGRNPVRY